jgi:hypothetical protein
MSEQTIIRSARLVYKGLQPRLRPAQDVEYQSLLRDYQSDEQFRRNVHQIAAGMHCTVVDVSVRFGIILAPAADTRFSMTAADFRARLKIEDKGILALILVAIAATFFPTASSLDSSEVSSELSATVNQIRQRLQAICRGFEAAHASDPSALPPHLQDSWRAILRKPSVRESRESDGGKILRGSVADLNGMILIAIRGLVDGGLLVEEESSNEPQYIPLSRFRIQVRELAADRLFELAGQIISKE